MSKSNYYYSDVYCREGTKSFNRDYGEDVLTFEIDKLDSYVKEMATYCKVNDKHDLDNLEVAEHDARLVLDKIKKCIRDIKRNS